MHVHAEITVPIQKKADTLKKLESLQKEAAKSGGCSISWHIFLKCLRVWDMDTLLVRYVEQASFMVQVGPLKVSTCSTGEFLPDGATKIIVRLSKMESKKYNWLKYVSAWDIESVVAITIRYGYISRAKAVKERITSTEEYLRGILTRPKPFPIAQADREKAAKVIAWARMLTDSQDETERGFSTIAHKGNVEIANLGDAALMPVVFLMKNHSYR